MLDLSNSHHLSVLSPAHLFASLQSALVLFLFLFLSLSILLSESTSFLHFPSNLFFGLAASPFYLHYFVASSAASVQTSNLQAKCDTLSGRMSALASFLCLALACNSRLLVADVALGGALCLQGLWELKVHCLEEVRREMEDLYALDFDGVICDNCGETALSTVKAATVRWPSLFNGMDFAVEDWIVVQMHTLRPMVETGYETLLLVRLLLEMRLPAIRKSTVAVELTVEGILENWLKIKPVIMEEWSENREDLMELFGKLRD